MDVIGYAALFVAFALPVIAYMVLSATWYSALFGELFLSLAFPNSPPTNTDSPLPYLAALCGNIIANGGVYCLVEFLGTESVFEGACYGALIAVISLGVGLPHPFFEDRSIKLFLLHKSLHLIGLTLMGAYHTVLHLPGITSHFLFEMLGIVTMTSLAFMVVVVGKEALLTSIFLSKKNLFMETAAQSAQSAGTTDSASSPPSSPTLQKKRPVERRRASHEGYGEDRQKEESHQSGKTHGGATYRHYLLSISVTDVIAAALVGCFCASLTHHRPDTFYYSFLTPVAVVSLMLSMSLLCMGMYDKMPDALRPPSWYLLTQSVVAPFVFFVAAIHYRPPNSYTAEE